MNDSVVRPWVYSLSFKMQTVLLTGIRGPDTHNTPHIKKFTRWIRSLVLHNADPGTPFMREAESIENVLPSFKDYEREIDYCSIHFFSHLIHTLTIIAYKHPDHEIRRRAWYYLYEIVETLHLVPETEEHIDSRLRDQA